jgi:hypothetical protein
MRRSITAALAWALLGCSASYASPGDAASGADAGPARDEPPTVVTPPPQPARSASPACAEADDPQWERQPEAPQGCGVERARCPQHVFEPAWEPCHEPEGPPSCRRLVHPEGWDCVFGLGRGTHDGERGWFSVGVERKGSPRRLTLLVPTDGPAAGAWRDEAETPDPQRWACTADLRIFDDAAALWLTDRDHPGAALYRAAVPRIGRARAPLAMPRSPSAFAVSDAALLSFRPYVGFWRDGALRVLDDGEAPLGRPEGAVLLGDHAVWVRSAWEEGGDTRARSWLRHARLGGEAADYHVPPDGWMVRDLVAGPGVLAWTRVRGGFEGDHDRIELWTATPAPSAEALAPRFVAVLSELPGQAAVGGGYYAFAAGDELRVVELSTGRRGVFRSAYAAFDRPLYASATEILAAFHTRGWTSVFRFDPRELFGDGP